MSLDRVWFRDTAALRETVLRRALQEFQAAVESWRDPEDATQARVAVLRWEWREKSFARADEKAVRKDVDEISVLESPYPIRDLIGVRAVVRTLRDLEKVTAIVEDAAAQRGYRVIDRDNKVETPSPTGYRSIHLDCLITEYFQGEIVEFPVELQVKTVCQDAWGHLTHGPSYSRTRDRHDARFVRVVELHRVMADQLQGLEVLAESIDALAADALDEISTQPLDDDWARQQSSPHVVMNVYFAIFEEVPTRQAAQGISDKCAEVGIPQAGMLVQLMAGEPEGRSSQDLLDSKESWLGERLDAFLADTRWPVPDFVEFCYWCLQAAAR